MDAEWVEETRERMDRMSAFLNKNAVDLWLQACVLEDDLTLQRKQMNEIDAFLDAYELRQWRSERPIISSPEKDKVDGDISIGTVFQGDVPICEFKIPKTFFLRHILTCGQTGAGKTSVNYNIQDQLIRAGIPVLSFDLKLDYRALLPKFKNLVVIPWHLLFVNLLRPPPSMPIRAWLAIFSQIAGFSWSWYIASSNYMQQHLDILCDRYEETGHLPTLFQLYASISQTTESTRRKSEYHDSVENRISTLVSILGDVAKVEEGIPLEKLLERPCVIELHGLRPAEQNWFVEVILSWIYYYRLYQGHRGEELRHVIFIDEAQNIFDRSKEIRSTAIEMGTPIISIFPSQFRDFGTGLVLASQQPSQIMNTVHANTLVKLASNLTSGTDVVAIGEAMGLNEEQIECIHKLKRAQWIVRMSDGWTEPFLIETPNYPVERNITDEEVIERLQSVFSEYLPKDKPKKHEEPKPKVILPQLSDNAWALLFDVNKHPFRGSLKSTGISTRYTALNFSSRRGNSAKNELIQKKLVKEEDIPVGGYRPAKFLVLTDLAINILRNMGHDVRLSRHTGHMGFRHQLYTVLIACTFKRAGYQTFIEKTLKNGRRVDVLTILDDKKVAIEVEVGPSIDIKTKLQALEEVDELVIVADEETNLQDSQINELPQAVKLYHITDYIRWLKANYSSNYSSNIHGIKYANRNKANSHPKIMK